MNDPVAIMNVRVALLERKIDFLLKSLNLHYLDSFAGIRTTGERGCQLRERRAQ